MIQESFAKGHSPIHRTNPVLRIVLATFFSFTVTLMIHPAPLTLALCFSIGLTLCAHLPKKPLIHRLAAVCAVLFIVWLVVPLSHTNDAIIRLGPVSLSRSGVQLCLQITLKAITLFLAFTALVATMPTATMGHALHRLGMPAKLVQLLLLAYRYIFIIEQEYQRLHRAAKMRNFQPATNRHTYKTYAYLMGMLFVRASERADRVYQAMKCRGFKGEFFTLTNYHPTSWNMILAICLTLVNVLIIYWEWKY